MAASVLPPRHHFPCCTFRICRRCHGGDHEEAGGARRARRINVAASLARRGWLRLDIDGEDMSGRNLSLIHEVRLA